MTAVDADAVQEVHPVAVLLKVPWTKGKAPDLLELVEVELLAGRQAQGPGTRVSQI